MYLFRRDPRCARAIHLAKVLEAIYQIPSQLDKCASWSVSGSVLRSCPKNPYPLGWGFFSHFSTKPDQASE